MREFKQILFLTVICLGTLSIASPVVAAAAQEKATSALDQCVEENPDQPRSAYSPCLIKKLTDADKKMSIQLIKTRKQLTDTGSSAVKSALKSLASSQKSFLAFRKNECQRVGDAALGGSGAGDFQLGCMVDLTNWRIKQLSE